MTTRVVLQIEHIANDKQLAIYRVEKTGAETGAHTLEALLEKAGTYTIWPHSAQHYEIKEIEKGPQSTTSAVDSTAPQ